MSEVREWGVGMERNRGGRAVRWAAGVTALLAVVTALLLLVPGADDEGQVEPALAVPASELLVVAVSVLVLFAALLGLALAVITLRRR